MNEGVGERINKLRKKEGLTQRQLAAKLNVSPSTIGMYEQGRRLPHRHLLDLADIFGVTTDYLLLGAGDGKPLTAESFQSLVDNVTEQLTLAEPTTAFNGKFSGLRSLNREDIEYLCNAIITAQAKVDENSKK